MDETTYRTLLNKHFVPMFAGTELDETVSSRPGHALSAFGAPGSILLKPNSAAPYRIKLIRSQPFEREEKRLVDLFAAEFSRVTGKYDPASHYFSEIMDALIRRVLARLIARAETQEAVEVAIREFEALAAQTYEGHQITGALGITGRRKRGSISLADLLREDFGRVLSNGIDSMYVADAAGQAFNLAYLSSTGPVSHAPHRLGAIAGWTKASRNRVAVCLNHNGEVLVFSAGSLRFAKRRGSWRYYAHDSLIKRMGGVVAAGLRRSVYETALDASFSRTGGCIAIIARAATTAARALIREDDLFPAGAKARVRFLAPILTKPFHKLDRRLRQEIVAMDGATILDHEGRIISTGAIISIQGGSAAGAREAAAVTLSDHGLALKISEDGPITGYRNRKLILSV